MTDLRLSAAAAALPLLMAGCATQPAPRPQGQALDALLAFADPAICRQTDATARLIEGFVRNDPLAMDSDSWIEPGAVPAELRDRFGPITRIKHDEWWTIRTPVRGTLWGLPLTAIEQDFPVGGDAGGTTFEFHASARMVERAARARGLMARAGRSVPMGVPDGLAWEIGLHPDDDDPRRSRLSCGHS